MAVQAVIPLPLSAQQSEREERIAELSERYEKSEHRVTMRDGITLYMAVYHQDGWRIEAAPFEPATWGLAQPATLAYGRGSIPRPEPEARAESAPSPYSPWATARPQFWLPQWDALDHAGGRLHLLPAQPGLRFPSSSRWRLYHLGTAAGKDG